MKGISFKKEQNSLQGDFHRFVVKLFTNQKISSDAQVNTSLYTIVENRLSTSNGLFSKLINFVCISHYQNVYNTYQTHYSDNESYQITIYNKVNNRCIADHYNLKDIRQLLDTLPGEYRITYTLYISGLNCGQIANKLNLPINTIKERVEFVQFKLHQN